jgi:hypothetical protein
VFTGIQQVLSPAAWPISKENRPSIMHLSITEKESQEHVENCYRRGEFLGSLLHLLPLGVAPMCHCSMTSPDLTTAASIG